MNERKLDDYTSIVDEIAIKNIRESASSLSGKSAIHVNTVSTGGGVAEMLNTLVPLMNDIGIDTKWLLFKAQPEFFNVSKAFHNGMQGADIELDDKKKNIYVDYQKKNSLVTDEDIAVIHDPQPLGMIGYSKKTQPWIWRCHIDITTPNKQLWTWLVPFINRYDGVILSNERYKNADIKPKHHIIHPSIDPLSNKNKELSESEIARLLEGAGIDTSKPIITQVSRFDPWKDPIGVIKSFKKIREKVDCKLVLVGGSADDDPEGPAMLEKVRKAAVGDVQIFVNASDELVNAIQRSSHIVVQKSLREGFALTVSEALWKGTPVVGSNVGGIPLQIINRKTGFLVNNIKETADACVKLLKSNKLRENMGENAKEHVRQNFLVTRHLQNYVNLYKEYLNGKK